MNKTLGTAKMRNKGQMTIPKEVCTYLDLKVGDSISLVVENKKIVLKREKIIHEDFDIKD